FLQMNFYAAGNICGVQEIFRRAKNQIARINGQSRIVAQKFDAAVVAFKRQFVAKIDRLHDGFEFVEAVGALAENVQQQVDFAVGFFFERHELLSQKQNAPAENRRRVEQNGFRHVQLSNTL